MHHSLHVTPLQSSDVHTPLHVSLDWSAVFHFVAPLTDLRVPLHAPSNGSAVFHFATSLTDMHVPLHAPSDRSAVSYFIAPLADMHPSVCPIRSVCRISLCRSPDWQSRHLHVLAADLRLFSFSWDFDTAFAAAVMAPALIPAMIQTRHDTNWKLVVAKKVFPKDLIMMILRCEYL